MRRVELYHFHPKRWTLLTWLALLRWVWSGGFSNDPPSEIVTVDPLTGEFESIRRESLADLQSPVGWPLQYVQPADPAAALLPVWPVGSLLPPPVPPPPPATVRPLALEFNLGLISVVLVALVYVLQVARPRYTLRFLCGVVVAYAIYCKAVQLTGRYVSHDAAWWLQLSVYCSPIAAVLALRYSWHLRLKSLASRLWGWRLQQAPEDVEAAIAAAAKLEMQGDWDAAMAAFQEAADKWPEHNEYVQSCRDRIMHKQSLAEA